MKIEAIRKNKKVTDIAIWIKEYAHALRVVAGIFFFLALATGIFWIITNKNVEPIAYVFGLISSFIFSIPSIAEYISPSRKPIRHMDYHEILQFIKETDAKTDWKRVHTNYAMEAFLKEDIRLRIRARWDDEDSHTKSFNESWAIKHPDPNASKDWYDLIYDSALIEKFILVSVDGCRAQLPLPAFNTLEADPLTYKIAQIFDQKDSLDEYMERSGLTVKNT